MDTRLNSRQRTTLSEYHDGELAPERLPEVTQLLERSEEARHYLRELDSLRELAVDAFPPVAVGDAVIGGLAGAKLSSSAIQSAARATMAAKSGWAASWGVAGLATAAAAAALVIFVVRNDERPTSPDRARATTTIAAAPELMLDTATLVVPAMSTQEMVDFALHGRVPLGSERDRYLTVAPKEGSLAVHVADGSEHHLPHGLSGIQLAGFPGIDSIERALRTSLLKAPERGLAFRADLPELRMRALVSLENAAGELPEIARRAIAQARQELAQSITEMFPEKRASRPERAVPTATAAPEAHYFFIAGSDAPVGTGGGEASVVFENPFEQRPVQVSRRVLGNLEALVGGTGVAQASPALAASRSSGRRQRSMPVVRTGPREGARGRIDQQNSTFSFTVEHGNPFGVDSLVRMADEMILRTEHMIHRADSVRLLLEQRENWRSFEYHFGYPEEADEPVEPEDSDVENPAAQAPGD